ncbi:MAG: AP2 domain-containing protein [Anaerolineae bacterium]|nr:AP2 domain-containing protein [Anaerolineae bacterium]
MAYIVRLDKPKNSPHGTHGWQVRGRGKRGYHSKLFSDGQYGGSESALAAAKAYLQGYEESHPAQRVPSNQPYHQGKLLSSNTSGVQGVYYTKYPHRWDKERLVEYWCAFIPIGPEGQKRYHKKFNIERYGYKEARRLAIEFRQEWERAVKQGSEKALEEFFEEYHYSRLIDTSFGSEEWDTFGEGLLEIEASL